VRPGAHERRGGARTTPTVVASPFHTQPGPLPTRACVWQARGVGTARSETIRVGLERGKKLTFAVALDWPGWARAGKGDEAALATLESYASRFAPVAAAAGHPLPAERELAVVEAVAGSGTTDFGAPGKAFAADAGPMAEPERERAVALVEAAWAYLATVVAGAPAELRKGPRGGGRDRDTIVEHVVGAEIEYARKLGLPRRKVTAGDSAAVRGLRDELVAGLQALAASPQPDLWPSRYGARRIAWHVLDHAFEIEDRSD